MSEFGQAFLAQMDSEDLAWLKAALGIVAPDPMASDQLLSTREAAVRARVNVETIRRNVRAGTLEAERTGAHYKIRESSLEAWMRGEAKQPAPAPVKTRRPRSVTSGPTMSEAFKKAA
jgi:excisionase family DNA binding protein